MLKQTHLNTKFSVLKKEIAQKACTPAAKGIEKAALEFFPKAADIDFNHIRSCKAFFPFLLAAKKGKSLSFRVYFYSFSESRRPIYTPMAEAIIRPRVHPLESPRQYRPKMLVERSLSIFTRLL